MKSENTKIPNNRGDKISEECNTVLLQLELTTFNKIQDLICICTRYLESVDVMNTLSSGTLFSRANIPKTM